MSVDPYEQLAALAEAELALCEEGRGDELAPLYDRAAAIVATLPPQPLAGAAPALRRAAAAQERISRRLGVGLAEARGGLEHLHRGREAARSYAAIAGTQARR